MRSDLAVKLMKRTLTLWLFASAVSCLAQNQPNAYTLELGPGVHAIANPFDRGRNILNDILEDVPLGTRLFKWRAPRQAYDVPAFFVPCTRWVPPATTLHPGEGAFLQVTQLLVITLSGRPAAPVPRLDAVVGYNLVSCQSPGPCLFEGVFGFKPQPGDRVYKLDRPLTRVPKVPTELPEIASSIHTFGANGWGKSVPKFEICRSAFVYLSGHPRITRPPESQHVALGDTALFRARVLGSEFLSFQWRRGSNNIPGATNEMLVLRSVSPNDVGLYSLTVANRFGSSTSEPAMLVVVTAPVIIQHPHSLTVLEGQKAAFTVRAVGEPPLFYRWWTSQGILVAEGTKPSFTISEVKPEDAGSYFVTVTNRHGSAMSEAAFLGVLSPPRITEQPKDQMATFGESVRFRARAVGTPPLRYQWRLNGQIIPGATDNVLDVSRIEPADAGSYRVTVANAAGAINSERALLRILDLPRLPFEDKFPGGVITEISGLGEGFSFEATRDPEEPDHSGKIGGRSLWLTWIAKDSGIVTFTTEGSSFDTLLAAYVGDDPRQLTEIASDDDGGPFHTSRITFNAVVGTRYRIAVDGFNGAAGYLVLRWDLEVTPDLLPEIAAQPESTAVGFGEKAVFTVLVREGRVVRYQWLFEGKAIRGAVEPVLVIPDVQAADIGTYTVLVSRDNRVVESLPVRLEINVAGCDGPPSNIVTVDKLADLHETQRLQGASGGAGQLRPASFVLGYVGSRVFSLSGSTHDEGEPNHCGVVGGISRWFSYTAPTNGIFHLNTDGSDFDTVVAVYTGMATNYAGLTEVTCDNDSGLDGMDSKLSFETQADTTYFIAVDAVGGVGGNVQLNHVLLVSQVLTNWVRPIIPEYEFRVMATPAYPLSIEESSDLTDWQWMMTTQTVSGVYDFRDGNAPSSVDRYYRAYQIP